MLKIRLTRVGRKNDPSFRLVVTESTRPPRSAAYLENLGSYDPRKDNHIFNAERINYWLSKGAKLSDTAHNLLVTAKILDAKKIDVSKKKKGKVQEPAPEAKAE